MESDIIIQDDWSQPNVQIEIELQPIMESSPTFSETYIQLESEQSNTANKQIVPRGHVPRKSYLVDFTPKLGHDIIEPQTAGNKHLLIELTSKHGSRKASNGSNIKSHYKKNINTTTQTFISPVVAERKRSVLNGFRRNKRNCMDKVITNNDEARNKMIEVHIPAPTNKVISITGNSKKDTVIIDSMDENRDVEKLLPIYMTPKFKDTEFPNYPVIEKVESLAVVSACNVEIENAIKPVEPPVLQLDNEIAALWSNPNIVPVLEVDTGNSPILHNTRAEQFISIVPMQKMDTLSSAGSIMKPPIEIVLNAAERVEMNYDANKAFWNETHRPESASMLEVPMVTIEARAPPVRTVAPFLPNSSHLREALQKPVAPKILPAGGKSTLHAETYNSLLSRVKVLNLSKPLPRPKRRSKVPHRIRRAFKDIFKKDCSVSLPRILLYQCKDCSAARTSMFELIRHLCIGNIKKKRYQKKLTGKKATEIFYKCGNCSKYYITKQHLMNHIQLEHPGVQTLGHTVCYDIAGDLYHCNLCKIQYKDEKHLLDHYKEKHIIMHKCPLCPAQTFISRDLLVTHFFENHRQVTSLYRCGLLDCFVYFTEYKDLIEHTSSAHGQSIIKCMLCDTEFADKDILLQHILTVHNKPKHICDECHLQFPTADLLLSHKAVPQSERHAPDLTRFLLQCQKCSRYFIKTVDNKIWPPKNSFLEPSICISCLIPSETTLTVKMDKNSKEKRV